MHEKNIRPLFHASQKQNAEVVLAMIDCTTEANEPACAKHHVYGYPTVAYFRQGEWHAPFPNKNPRTKAEFMAFAKK